jgi:hypothetical protein
VPIIYLKAKEINAPNYAGQGFYAFLFAKA